MGIWVQEHDDPGYRGRTLFNAQRADLTIAFTVDASTHGEQLTRQAATEARYGHIDLNVSSPSCAAHDIHTMIATKLEGLPFNILNIAGNGLQTLSRHGWTQCKINQYIFDTFVELRDMWNTLPAKGLRSGGQTGVDMAAAVMAKELNLDAVIMMPRGFRQRGADGTDILQTRDDVLRKIAAMSYIIESDNRPLSFVA